MAIKEELKDDVKEDGGGKDELDALDALEKEAAEFNQVRPPSPPSTCVPNNPSTGCRNRSHNQSLQTRFVSPVSSTNVLSHLP
jgi:hypothetical protein